MRPDALASQKQAILRVAFPGLLFIFSILQHLFQKNGLLSSSEFLWLSGSYGNTARPPLLNCAQKGVNL